MEKQNRIVAFNFHRCYFKFGASVKSVIVLILRYLASLSKYNNLSISGRRSFRRSRYACLVWLVQTVVNRHVYGFFIMSSQRSVMSTPVGKGGGLNVTVDIEVDLLYASLTNVLHTI